MAITLDGNNTNTVGVINSATAKNATGTAVDFTGIPAGTKRITVMFSGVSTNGSSLVQIQIGSGAAETTGYSSAASTNASSGSSANSTTGFLVVGSMASTIIFGGVAIITLVGSNQWAMSFAGGRSDSASALSAGGWKTIGGVLDRVRITTVNGTDTFDAGSINILYE